MSYINTKKLRANRQIKVPEVRLIDQNGDQVGIVDVKAAQSKATDAGLDLVEVSPNANPPVCKIMDYGKWLYEQKKKAKDSQKQHKTTLKEIRLRPETEKHDIDIKVRKARKFLEKGDKVQFSIFFRGRQMLHQDQGHEMLEDIKEEMSDIAKVERPEKMTNRRMTLLLGPK